MSPHTYQNGYYTKDKKQVLARMLRKPFALLVGMQIGIDTMENGMEAPQKIKSGTTI